MRLSSYAVLHEQGNTGPLVAACLLLVEQKTSSIELCKHYRELMEAHLPSNSKASHGSPSYLLQSVSTEQDSSCKVDYLPQAQLPLHGSADCSIEWTLVQTSSSSMAENLASSGPGLAMLEAPGATH